MDCQKKSKEKYTSGVELILGAAAQIREEVSAMEVDILVSENMTEVLERTRPQMERIAHDVHMATVAASSLLFGLLRNVLINNVCVVQINLLQTVLK